MDEDQKFIVVLRIEQAVNGFVVAPTEVATYPAKLAALRNVLKQCTPPGTYVTTRIVRDIATRGRRLLVAPTADDVARLDATIAEHATKRAAMAEAVSDLRTTVHAMPPGAARTEAMEDFKGRAIRLFQADQKLARLQGIRGFMEVVHGVAPAPEVDADADVDDADADDPAIMALLFEWPL